MSTFVQHTPVSAALPDSAAERSQSDRFAKLEHRIARYQRERNACAPISALPQEILSMIFMEQRNQYAAEITALSKVMVGSRESPPIDTEEPRPEWIVAAHVCHKWRGIVNKNPALWTTIYSRMGAGWMEACLERSADRPLLVAVLTDLHGLGDTELKVVVKALKQSKRLRSIDLVAGPPLMKTLLASICSSAPILENLVLRSIVPESRSVRRALFDSQPLVFDSHCCLRDTPNLRYLELENVILPCTSHLFTSPKLRVVDIATTYWSYKDWPGAKTLCRDVRVARLSELLSRLPSTLESLVLNTIFPDLSTRFPDLVQPEGNQRPCFPFLKKFQSMQATYPQVSRILSHLRIPTTAVVTLWAFSDPSNRADFRRLKSELSSCWLPAESSNDRPTVAASPAYTSMSVKTCQKNITLTLRQETGPSNPTPLPELKLLVGSSKLLCSGQEGVPDGQLVVRNDGDNDSQLKNNFKLAMTVLPSLATISMLDLGDTMVGISAMRYLLSTAVNLKKIVVGAHGVYDLIQCLAFDRPVNGVSSSPKLETLVLNDIDFDAEPNVLYADDNKDRAVTIEDTTILHKKFWFLKNFSIGLNRALKQRMDKKMKLSRLEFCNCKLIPPWAMMTMESLVDELVWNGVQVGEPETSWDQLCLDA